MDWLIRDFTENGVESTGLYLAICNICNPYTSYICIHVHLYGLVCFCVYVVMCLEQCECDKFSYVKLTCVCVYMRISRFFIPETRSLCQYLPAIIPTERTNPSHIFISLCVLNLMHTFTRHGKHQHVVYHGGC